MYRQEEPQLEWNIGKQHPFCKASSSSTVSKRWALLAAHSLHLSWAALTKTQRQRQRSMAYYSDYKTSARLLDCGAQYRNYVLWSVSDFRLSVCFSPLCITFFVLECRWTVRLIKFIYNIYYCSCYSYFYYWFYGWQNLMSSDYSEVLVLLCMNSI